MSKVKRLLAVIMMMAMMTGLMTNTVNACSGYSSRWSAPIIAVNYSSNDQVSSYSTFRKSDTVYFHFRLSGNDGEFTDVTTIITTPEGERLKYVHSNCTNGYNGWGSWYYKNSAYGATGYLTMDIYDAAGCLIGSGVVKIVD